MFIGIVDVVGRGHGNVEATCVFRGLHSGRLRLSRVVRYDHDLDTPLSWGVFWGLLHRKHIESTPKPRPGIKATRYEVMHNPQGKITLSPKTITTSTNSPHSIAAPFPFASIYFSGFKKTSLEGKSNLVCVLTIAMNSFCRSSPVIRPLNRLNSATVVMPDAGTCARSSATVGKPRVSTGAALGAGYAISIQ